MIQKLLCLLTLTILTTISVHAQNLTESEIVGSWVVTKINVLDNDVVHGQQAKLKMLKKMFMTAKFAFKADNRFGFDISDEEMKIKNGHWRQDKSSKSFIIQDWKDKDTNKSLLMEISAKKVDAKILFLISETFFELEMKKI